MKLIKRLRPYNRARLWLVVGLFGLSFLAILGRLFFVQVMQHARYAELAQEQYLRHLTLRPERGQIFDRHGRVLATSISVPSLYGIPREIDASDQVIRQLAKVLQQPVTTTRGHLTAKAPFVWMARHMTPEMVKDVQALGLKGVYFQDEPHRYYPKHHLAGQVLGFVGIDEQGLGGLEYLYNRALSGRPRRIILERDAVGRRVRVVAGDTAEPPRGVDLHLTLDEWLQHLAEREIASQVQQTKARSGQVIIMQPQTGYILAMALYPFFDPNEFRDPSQQLWQRNRAVTDPIEPGSTFKLVVAAASIEESTVALTDRFFCENGTMTQGRRRIRDHKPHGVLSFPEVIAYSSNIGTIKVSERLSSVTLYHYIRRFGFAEKSLVDLPGEAEGQLLPPPAWSQFSHASLSIGQEIAVTPLQLIAAFAAVANGGVLMQPRIVQRIDRGYEVQHIAPEVRWRVLSRQTAEKLTAILTEVVTYGTGKLAAVPGYTVAGKTGTAQKVDPQRGGYSTSKVSATFVGYVPAEQPQLAILVTLDEPQTSQWGGMTAAPVFQRIAQQALPYLHIPPSQAQTIRLAAPVEYADVEQLEERRVQKVLSDLRAFVGLQLAHNRE